MKITIPKTLLLLAALLVAVNGAWSATLTPGYTFGTTEQVTAAKLATLVSGATLSGVSASDISNGAIGNLQLGANAVTTDKILDATILTGDIASRTLLGANIATNAITEIELSTNLFFRTGTMSFSNVTIAASSIAGTGVSGVTTSAGAGDSGKIPKLDSTGKLNYSFLPNSSLITTNLSTKTGGSSYTWFTVTTLTTTATNGNVTVSGRIIAPSASGYNWLRIRDASNNVLGQQFSNNSGNTSVHQLSVSGSDTLTGSAKTYTMEAASITASVVLTNAAASTASDPGATDGMGMKILQIQ